MQWISVRMFNKGQIGAGIRSGLAVGMMLMALTVHAAAPGPDGNRGNLNRLLHNQKVLDHLAMTAEQSSAAQSISNEEVENYRADFVKALESPERAERVPKVTQVFALTDARAHERLKTILRPAQLQRLQQIELQAMAMRAFTRADVVKNLNLSAAQQQALKDLANSVGVKLSGVQRSASLSAEEKSQQISQVRLAALAQVRQQLSAEQWLQWELLTGAEFTL